MIDNYLLLLFTCESSYVCLYIKYSYVYRTTGKYLMKLLQNKQKIIQFLQSKYILYKHLYNETVYSMYNNNNSAFKVISLCVNIFQKHLLSVKITKRLTHQCCNLKFFLQLFLFGSNIQLYYTVDVEILSYGWMS